MPIARITALPIPLTASVQALMDKLVPPTMVPPELFRTVAKNEGLFRDMIEMKLLGPTGLFDRQVLPSRLRELLILRTCVATKNEYEYQLHVRTISEKMGLSVAQIKDVLNEDPDPTLWAASELAAINLVDMLIQRLEVSDELFVRLREHFDEAALIEMTQLIGMYNGVAMMVALIRPQLDNY